MALIAKMGAMAGGGGVIACWKKRKKVLVGEEAECCVGKKLHVRQRGEEKNKMQERERRYKIILHSSENSLICSKSTKLVHLHLKICSIINWPK